MIISSRYLIENVKFWRKIDKNKKEAILLINFPFFVIISNPKCGILDRRRLAKMRERDFPSFLISKNKEEARSIFLPDFPFFVIISSNPKCGVLDRERLAKMRKRDFPFFLIDKNKEEARSIFLPDFPFFVIISSRYLIENVDGILEEEWQK